MSASIQMKARLVKDFALQTITRVEEVQKKRKQERIVQHQLARERLRNLPIIRWFKRWIPLLTEEEAFEEFTWNDSWYASAHSVQHAECGKILAAACLSLVENGDDSVMTLTTKAIEELGLAGYRHA